MSKADIDARSGDDNYISVQTLVEEANAEYTILVASNRWGSQGKQDPSGAPEALFTKAELNMLVQNKCQQLSRARILGAVTSLQQTLPPLHQVTVPPNVLVSIVVALTT